MTYLIKIGSRLRRQVAQARNQDIGHQFPLLKHLLRLVEFPRGRHENVSNCAAPRRVHGVVNVASHVLGNLNTDSSEGSTVGEDSANGLGELMSGLGAFNNGTGKQPATVLGDSNLNQGCLGIELLKVVVKLFRLVLVLDAELLESISDGLNQVLELLQRNARCSHGGDGEGGVGKEVQTHHTFIDDGGKMGIVELDGLEESGVGDTVRGESEVQAGDMAILMSLGGHGPDNSVGTTTATGQSPVEIRVMGAVRSEELASAVDNLPLEDLVGSESVLGS